MIKYNNLLTKQEKISIIGLGYVGLPIAVAFAKKVDVIGFDISEEKINQYKKGIDPTKEVGNEAVAKTTVRFTNDPTDLKNARFHIVAVPTPVKNDKTPDLTILESACYVLGKNLIKGSVVVFESTVYPGVTEEICMPILETESGLECGKDFKIGYSPERINPGDKEHRLENIVKVVSGMDNKTLDIIENVYKLVIDAGVYRATSIKVAEAAKVIENSQRDINIAFMNELALIFHRLGIDTSDVLAAAGTKWNFLNFKPGLVGGHCIGVDPYYLTHRAEQFGYSSQIITSGRKINDGMGKYIAEVLVKKMISADVHIKGAIVGILGFTFKENCPDTRNTRVIDIINELYEYDIATIVADPVADKDEALREYGVEIKNINDVNNVDAVIIAVGHEDFISLSYNDFNNMYTCIDNHSKVLMDIKGVLEKNIYIDMEYNYWRM